MSVPKNGNGTSKRQFWITTIIAGFFVVTAIVSYIVQLNTIGSTGTSNTDRIKALEDRAYNADLAVQQLQKDMAVQQASLKEIETQFCASDIVRNLMHGDELREMASLHEKVFGQSYHTDNAYYPSICNRPAPQ